MLAWPEGVINQYKMKTLIFFAKTCFLGTPNNFALFRRQITWVMVLTRKTPKKHTSHSKANGHCRKTKKWSTSNLNH